MKHQAVIVGDGTKGVTHRRDQTVLGQGLRGFGKRGEQQLLTSPHTALVVALGTPAHQFLTPGRGQQALCGIGFERAVAVIAHRQP